MVARRSGWWKIALLFVLNVLLSPLVQAASYAMPANTTVNLNICDPNSNTAPLYYHYSMIGSGYTAYVNSVAYNFSGSNFGAIDTQEVPGSPAPICMTFAVQTSGVPAGASNAYFQISSCHDYPATGKTCDGLFRQYYLITPPAANIAVSPSTTITTEGTTSITATATVPSQTTQAGALFAGIAVNAACTAQNGAQITVSPASQVTTAEGTTAAFQITTAGLRYAAPGPAPSGTCTFSSPNGTNASIQIQGTFVGGTLSLSSSNISHTGTVPVTATISTGVPNTPVTATCTQSVYSVSVTPATVNTDATGKASFSVTANSLYIYDATGSTPAAPYCVFQIGSGGSSSNLQFTAGNACTFGLQPPPPQCGSP